MRFSWIHPLRSAPVLALAGAAAAIASPAAAQVRPDTTAPYVAPVAADSATPAWMPDPAGIFIGHQRITPAPPGLIGPRLSRNRLELHRTDLSGRWWTSLEESLAASRDALWLDTHGLIRAPGQRRRILAVGPDTVRYLPYQEEADTTPTLESFLPGTVGQYADLGMLVTGRGEMGGAWQSFEPCDAVGFNSCDQGLTPRLRPDLAFGVLLGGTITDRVHVAVDYDQTREFDAANNINLYYQGLEDEILQRFEVGDVSITMPQSQYLTGGIPGGNFGFRALAQVGPLELQSVWAQQQGDVGSLDINIDARTGSMYEEHDIPVDDHAYASGRFFFLVDPAQLPDYPHIDVLLQELDAPDVIRPAGDIQLYREEGLPPAQREASRVFRADAVPPDGTEPVHGGWFRRLEPGEYVVHPSNLWIMLRQPLGRDEALAMSYVTATGDTVGTMDAASGSTDVPQLRLVRGPLSGHHPAASTWAYEMHQIYQVYAGELNPEDLGLEITLGDGAQGQPYVDYQGEQVRLLKLFGVDATPLDQRVDVQRIFKPSTLSYVGGSAITGTYLVFPTLRPFADPPPTAGLSAQEADAALAGDANHRIYEERDPDLRSIARFRLLMQYRVRTDGLISEFSLDAFGVREGSERILVDGVALSRGTDYTVDYTTGTVHLVNPQQLFAGRSTPRITATFEQSALFQIAPKSLFGTTARWRVGEAGEVNLVGLYQNQRSVMTRPQLGNEPNSIMMGGMTTSLRFGANWMDRALDAIPGLRLAGRSSIDLSGEFAMSAPNPNTRGVAWLEDFEATAEIPIGMNQNSWRLGSRPGTSAGAGVWLPGLLDASNVFTLVWQHQAYGANGGTFGAFVADSVDRRIVTAGGNIPEAVLYVTMRDDPDVPVGERVWRSMTTVLSTSGADLTSSEYLEFYALESTEDIALVFDLGRVSEDAFFVDSLGRTEGEHPVTGERWGLGILDQEADHNQPWARDLDLGIWDEGCRTEPGLISLLGSTSANCTVNNGINDTEDLNGDGVPNLEDGAYFRYTVPIGPSSPYLSRDTDQTGTKFRLYRVPLRAANAVALNGAGAETWRAIRHLRMTVTSGNCTGVENCRPDALLLSRMRITGSTWKKRQIEGVLAGMIGVDTIPGDHSRNVHVGPVSTLTDGSAYRGPPGATDEASDPSQGFAPTGVEVNEKGLRVVATELEPDARAEVFYRFPSESRSFMEYQQLRLWALPRAGDWGPDGTLSLLVKIGTDDGNYYMYRTRLRPPIENRDITTPAYWLPEVVIDFEAWFRLKAMAETEAVQSGAGEQVIWDDDSTHAIVLSRRAQAPNLGAIRELSLAIHNGAGLPADSAELWVNDLRLADGRTDPGFAGFVSVAATAADFASVRLSVSNQGARFHPMNRDASLETTNDIGVTGRLELGHFAPAGWGVTVPVTVQHTRQDRAPEFLSRTDIRASDLEGLRESGASTTQVGVGMSKTTPAATPWLGLLFDGTRLNLNWRSAARDAFTQSNSTSQFNGSVSYDHQLRARSLDVVPGFVESFLRLISPARVEQSDFFGRVSSARLRWSPSSVSFASSYLDRKSETRNYPAVLEGPLDADIQPVRSPQEDLENSASIGFRPFESLSARITTSSARDLLPPEELTTTPLGREAVRDARTALGGFDLGWEKSRSLGANVELQPRISSWLRPSITWTSDYRTSRTPHYLELEVVGSDTVDARMQRDFQVDGQLQRRLYFDPAGLARVAWGAEAAPELGFVRGTLHRLAGAIIPLDLSWTDQRNSLFQRSADEPGFGYRFAMGSLGSLRLVHGDTAVNAAERHGFQARSGLRLPLGFQLDASYAGSERLALSGQGSNNDIEDRTWPDLRLGLATLPIPAAVSSVISRASASAGFRVESTEQRFGNTLLSRETESIPVQLSTTFAGGVTTSYTGTFGTSEGRQTTGLNRGNDAMHGVQLRASFDPPESLGPKFEQPIAANLGFNYSSRRICEVNGLGGAEEDTRCAERVDNISRDFHLTLESMVDQLNLGVQFSLNDRQSFVGMRNSSREFRLAVFANFNFGVGILPEGLGAGRIGY
ncbi:MAG TPA: cell surface protein SprA [Longimicrobiales bacterium]|nr:cell surface protein SprA [Longimicrobiales bacterium]